MSAALDILAEERESAWRGYYESKLAARKSAEDTYEVMMGPVRTALSVELERLTAARALEIRTGEPA